MLRGAAETEEGWGGPSRMNGCHPEFTMEDGPPCVCFPGWEGDCGENKVAKYIFKRVLKTKAFWILAVLIIMFFIFFQLSLSRTPNYSRCTQKFLTDFAFTVFFFLVTTSLTWWQFPFQTPQIHWSFSATRAAFVAPLHQLVSHLTTALSPLYQLRGGPPNLNLSRRLAYRRKTIWGVTLAHAWDFAAATLDIVVMVSVLSNAMGAQHYFFLSERGALVCWVPLLAGVLAYAVIACGNLVCIAQGTLAAAGAMPTIFNEDGRKQIVPGSGWWLFRGGAKFEDDMGLLRRWFFQTSPAYVVSTDSTVDINPIISGGTTETPTDTPSEEPSEEPSAQVSISDIVDFMAELNE
eukprot:gnl/Chilomastix_cuspidata/2167.p1 GENE.gnl/Chilomastix_cuspidata/2167~~gnl/Chilomastix_cuspidata/2167.p1  ORF type:complete len:350 (+),score=36.23 gnl/Chilomastix_cuspidata/2167:65-1114(+)